MTKKLSLLMVGWLFLCLLIMPALKRLKKQKL